MPITLSKIASNSAHVAFSYGGDSVNLVYYPGRVTEKIFLQLQSFASMKEEGIASGFAAFNATLVNLIKSWDVFEDDEQATMFPLEADRLAELPFAFRVACIQTMVADMRPNAPTPQS
ncbi:MAG: hypothetical protein ACRDHZ_00805 [Ktedonobacteraceae bacterium]